MAWDDWGLGLLTGGVYNVGKTVYKAGKAAEQAGDAVEEIADGAGKALAGITTSVTQFVNSMNSFINELQEMVTIKRVTERSEDELWDEERTRLEALRKREAELVQQLTAMGKEDSTESWWDALLDLLSGSVFAEIEVRAKLAMVRGAINEILYEEPGVIPSSLHTFELILERFNTLEQPQVEDIFEGVHENLDSFNDIQAEVKKLFVVKTWRAVPVASENQGLLAQMEDMRGHFLELSEYAKSIHLQLLAQLKRAHPGEVHLHPADYMAPRPRTLESGVTESMRLSEEITASSSMIPQAIASIRDARWITSLSGPRASALSRQPMMSSISSVLKQNMVGAYLYNMHAIDGQRKYYLREITKLDKAIFRLRFELVEEPGVIPKLLNEIHRVIEHIHAETEPRLDTILGGINDATSELKQVLAKVRQFTEFLSSMWVKIGLGVLGGLLGLTLLMLLIVLFRTAFRL